MSKGLYVWIPNWDSFQHYKDRNPPWIKNHVQLLDHDAYMNLSGHLRGILHSTWMAYARSARRLPGDTLTLTRRLGIKVSRRDLAALNQAGFIELVASDVLAERLQAASKALALARGDAPSQEAEAEAQEQEPGSNRSYPTTAPEPAPELDPEPRFDHTERDNQNGTPAHGAGAGAGEFQRIDPHTILEQLRGDAA